LKEIYEYKAKHYKTERKKKIKYILFHDFVQSQMTHRLISASLYNFLSFHLINHAQSTTSTHRFTKEKYFSAKMKMSHLILTFSAICFSLSMDEHFRLEMIQPKYSDEGLSIGASTITKMTFCRMTFIVVISEE
jgi:hypothetical protein